MANSYILKFAALAALTLDLGACGDVGGGVNSTSLVQTPAPAPTPVPTPGPSPSPAHLGLVSDQPFATVYASPGIGTGEDLGNGSAPRSDQNLALELRYIPASNSYEITLPGLEKGQLNPFFSNGDFTGSHVVTASGAALPAMEVHLPVPGGISSPYTYTSYGFWSAPAGTIPSAGTARNYGVFAYGIPTRVGDVPTTGAAKYLAPVNGYIVGGVADGFFVSGSAELNFDFAAGQLSGYMNPVVPEGGWAGIANDLGRYEFTQTIFGVGSSKYSGSFIVPNLPGAASSFSGTFTGPQAAELMARFEAPFLSNGGGGTLVGVWLGKKQ